MFNLLAVDICSLVIIVMCLQCPLLHFFQVFVHQLFVLYLYKFRCKQTLIRCVMLSCLSILPVSNSSACQQNFRNKAIEALVGIMDSIRGLTWSIYAFVATCFDFETDGGEEFCCWTEQQASTRIGQCLIGFLLIMQTVNRLKCNSVTFDCRLHLAFIF